AGRRLTLHADRRKDDDASGRTVRPAGRPRRMTSGLTLILIVAAAYLAARIAFRYLAQRFMITSGAEYLVLGILLGPHVSGLMSASVVDSFGPFMTLAIGWMGAVIGV